MKASKGFTLVEAMVALTILAFALAGSLSFFIFQSRSGFTTFKHKTSDDAVFFTQTLIQRDITQAGTGVSVHPELAVFVNHGVSGGSDDLFLNYSGYLTLNDPGKDPDPTTQWAVAVNSIFAQTRSGYQGWFTLANPSQFVLRAIPLVSYASAPVTSMNPNVGAIITSMGAASDINVKGTTAVPGIMQGTQDWTFPLAVPVAAGSLVAPAISYKWRQTTVGGETIGSLWRNRGADATPYDAPILGGETYMNVLSFNVRCQYLDGTWQTTNTSPTTLRLVEVTIIYETRSHAGFWNSAQTRVFSASPRAVRYF